MDVSTTALGIKTRILIISDTHGASSLPGSQPLPPVDVAIHCGDLTEESKLIEFQNTITLMKSINAPLKVMIAGNHDWTLDTPIFKSKIAEIPPPVDMALVHAGYGTFNQSPRPPPLLLRHRHHLPPAPRHAPPRPAQRRQPHPLRQPLHTVHRGLGVPIRPARGGVPPMGCQRRRGRRRHPRPTARRAGPHRRRGADRQRRALRGGTTGQAALTLLRARPSGLGSEARALAAQRGGRVG
ncbi:serine/threonine phosphatase [Colletotrichum chrysophilum]|uniref:Serine/threonine phosphatase n=1 Tax=Colletotrichum chrysophilum TaxID=1836956 RepID=A0AAD9ENU6_9PEZI|nr:serine/threonine phosphatase [Colletotrichum chrysophilum]